MCLLTYLDINIPLFELSTFDCAGQGQTLAVTRCPEFPYGATRGGHKLLWKIAKASV